MRYVFLITLAVIGLRSYSQSVTALSTQEKNDIIFMREEEKLARDVYDSMYNKWQVNPFGNIRKSERVHMDKMKALIDMFTLEDPVIKTNDEPGKFMNATLQQYYHQMVAEGSNSLVNALMVGARIEEIDIKDLNEKIALTKDAAITETYKQLINASHNHLRAFVRRLKSEGVIYTPSFLNETTFNSILSNQN